MVQGCEALTEKEKQTLRLLLVGHDAKSMARHLGLSVHTINERLREARRKLSVSSSKEAARLLRQSEATASQSVGYTPFGDAPPASTDQLPEERDHAPPTQRRGRWPLGGLAMIPIFAVTLALLVPAQAPQAGTDAPAVAETVVTKAARDWLALVDAGKWNESWTATAQSFRSLNTVGAWQSASEKARVPLGQVLSRTLVSEQDIPAPPHGYRTVRFRTDFTNKRGAIETVSLDRENGGWKIVGIYVE
jgi:DNA-binding CsgD family transcriptional regulator